MKEKTWKLKPRSSAKKKNKIGLSEKFSKLNRTMSGNNVLLKFVLLSVLNWLFHFFSYKSLSLRRSRRLVVLLVIKTVVSLLNGQRRDIKYLASDRHRFAQGSI